MKQPSVKINKFRVLEKDTGLEEKTVEQKSPREGRLVRNSVALPQEPVAVMRLPESGGEGAAQAPSMAPFNFTVKFYSIL